MQEINKYLLSEHIPVKKIWNNVLKINEDFHNNVSKDIHVYLSDHLYWNVQNKLSINMIIANYIIEHFIPNKI